MLYPIQVDESPNTGKISLGLSVIVRVTLRNGTYHEVGDFGTDEHGLIDSQTNNGPLGRWLWPY
jgi:recombination DNA repair RAD52 pathway protein